MADNDGAHPAKIELPPVWRILHELDVARMVAQHAALRRLCNQLEDCADRLPDRGAIVEAAGVAAAIATSLCHHEIVENDTLADVFAASPVVAIDGLLDRIRRRHAIDHLHAVDLHEALTTAAKTVGPIRADTLSYMMRCLFDGCRGGIDFQEAAILMLARDRLTPPARATLNASLTGASGRSAA